MGSTRSTSQITLAIERLNLALKMIFVSQLQVHRIADRFNVNDENPVKRIAEKVLML